MSLLLGSLIFGLAQGGAVALLGAGLVAVNRGSRVINLAHGAVGMVATYIFASIALADGRHPSALRLAVAALAGVATGALLGLAADRAVMHRLVERAAAVRLTATLGLLYVLLSGAQLIWGADTRTVPSIFGAGGHRLGPVTVSNDVAGVALLALVLSVALAAFYQRSRLGTTLRAVADSRESAQLGGIRVERMGAISWSLGGALAALAGIVLAPTVGLNSFILTLLVIQALAAALTGRMQHLLPTLVGGVVIGILTALTRAWLDSVTAANPPSWINLTSVGDGIALLWMVVAVARWGRAGPPRSARSFAASELLRAPVDGPVRAGMVLTGIAAAVAVPALLGGSGLYLLSIGAAYAVAILSLVVVTGMAGQLSLVQAGFMGVGAFTAAHLVAATHLPLIAVVPLGGVAAVPLGVVCAWMTTRAGGVLTAIVTLGIGQALAGLFFVSNLNGGATGTVALPRDGLLASPLHYAWFELLVLGLLITFVCALRTRKTGRVLVAIRESDAAAAAVAINVRRVRAMAFALAAFIAGVGGVLYAGVDQIASARTFSPFTSIGLLAAGVVGGLGSTAGAVIGGLLQALGTPLVSNLPGLSQLSDPGDAAGVLMGILLLVQVTMAPSGLSRPLLHAEAALARRLHSLRGPAPEGA